MATIFEKGTFVDFPDEFRREGLEVLQGITKFQIAYESPDTDTAINQIRDAMIGYYLGFEQLNTEKHGFDARRTNKSGNYEFLEIKQCSFTAKRLGGTWNDTSVDKARAFKDPRLFTAVAVWKYAADLQFIVYGQSPLLGEFLEERVTQRKEGSRSTQSVDITKMIKEFGFSVVCPADRDRRDVIQQIANYNRSLAGLDLQSIVKNISDI